MPAPKITFPQIVTDNPIVKNLGINKDLADKNKEKDQLFRYLGIEAYGQYVNGKLEDEVLLPFFKKIDAISEEIKELEKGRGIMCECGNELTSDMAFCPKCGKKVECGVRCECGAAITDDMAFCTVCGKKIIKKADIASKGGIDNDIKKECICGAMVSKGQMMCMECGRKIDW